MKKQKLQYGSFAVNSKNFFRSKKFIAVFALLALGGSFYGYQKFHHQNISGASVVIPQASASEIPGWWLHDYFGSSICSSADCQMNADPDGDKLTNAQEFYYNSNPLKKDTNGDGLTDGEDVAQGYDPSKPGKVTFASAASDDEVFGESLLYQKDVDNILSDMTDLSKVQLPTVSDAELNITSDNTKTGIATYLGRMRDINNQLFPDSLVQLASAGISNLSDSQIQTIKERASIAVASYKKLAVPSDAVAYHKYSIGIMMVLPTVVNQPTPEQINDVNDVTANYWYDQMQIYSALLQRLNLQEIGLRNKYNDGK